MKDLHSIPDFGFKLGRNVPDVSPERDKRFLQLRDFVVSPSWTGLVSAPLPVPPVSTDRDGGIPANSWGVLGNDRMGNCVLAGEAHYWMANSAMVDGKPIQIDEAALIALYRKLSPNDTGLYIGDTLLLEQKEGLLGEKIIGFVALDKRHDFIKLAIHEFGGCKLGVNLPQSAIQQFNRNLPWSVVKGSANVGGHDIEAFGYDQKYIYCVTWGRLVPVEWPWLLAYWGEAFARISPRWLGKSGVTPSGLDITALLDALSQMGDGPAPAPPPKPDPPKPEPPRPDPVLPPQPAAGTLSVDIDRKIVSTPPGWTFKNH